MVDLKTDVHIKDIQEAFGIDEELASSFVAAHDEYVAKLAELKNTEAAVTVTITTAMAFAGAGGMDPHTFMLLIQEVMMGLIYNPENFPVTDA